MTLFEDGPASGHSLLLTTAPVYLRVAVSHGGHEPGSVDALDRGAVRPEPGAVLYAYRRVAGPEPYHLQVPDHRTGRRGPMRFVSAAYRLCDFQPCQETLHDAAAWKAWCAAQEAAQEQPS